MNHTIIQGTEDDMHKDSNQQEITRVLNDLLADEYLLSTKTKNYHWNVTGAHFCDLHAFFGDQYARLDHLIGERVRALGTDTLGTMTGFLRCTRLHERPGVLPSDLAMVEDLNNDHEVLPRFLRGTLADNASMRWILAQPIFLRKSCRSTKRWLGCCGPFLESKRF